jgi:hypothetical protein
LGEKRLEESPGALHIPQSMGSLTPAMNIYRRNCDLVVIPSVTNNQLQALHINKQFKDYLLKENEA